MMPRVARKRSESGIYHVILRGINRQEIFYDEADYRYFIDVLREIKEGENYAMHAYCLMGNHVHMLIQEKELDLSSVMKRLGIRYAFWYNKRYKRVGHVFQDRYRSETVESDEYFLTVARYIHKNPVKAGVTAKAEEYDWSSCRDYYAQRKAAGLVDCEMLLGMLNGRTQFKRYMEEEDEQEIMEYEAVEPLSDKDVYEIMKSLLEDKEIGELNTINKEERNRILRQLKEVKGSSLRQISRVTGLGLNVIFKA